MVGERQENPCQQCDFIIDSTPFTLSRLFSQLSLFCLVCSGNHVVLLARISLTPSRFYHPLLQAGLLDYILCPYRAVVDKFQLVIQHLHVRAQGYVGERRLYVRPYYFISVLHAWFVLFAWFQRSEVGGRTAAAVLLPGFVQYSSQNSCAVLV